MARNALFLIVVLMTALPGKAQTSFERTFDPRTAVSVILEMSQATWNAIATQQPVGGVCAFNIPPATNRYPWQSSNITVAIERDGVTTQQLYVAAGVKKKSFCGSFDTVKPSLTINFYKTNNANQALAEAQLGTTHLSLENLKQDTDLFRQCAGYYTFRSMGLPAPMCSFASVYRRDPNQTPVFLGLYAMTESVKKEFFRRRPAIESTPNASLYEIEVPDDFTQPTLSQLQVEFSGTNSQDFTFAVNQFANAPATALAKTLDLPSFIDFWATEIFLKHWDGYTANRNNTFLFDDTPPATQIQKTRFRFIPHGVDQILNVNTKPAVYQQSVAAQRAYADNGLRYQLHAALAAYGNRIAAADVPGHIESYVPLVLRLWQGPDPLLGNDAGVARPRAENVKVAFERAVIDVQSVFGEEVLSPSNTPTRLVGSFFAQCATRVTSNPELSRASCGNIPGQRWVFDSMPQSMGSVGFAQPLKLYAVRNSGTQDCMTVGPQFTDGSQRWTLQMAACSAASAAQKFFVVRREGRGFELRSFAQKGCMHFSGSGVTTDGRPQVYVGECNNDMKKLIVAE